jgi:hypothetical protein
MAAIRLGETPFMGFLPCATFALRVKVRTLFGIKVRLCKTFDSFHLFSSDGHFLVSLSP